METYEKLGAFYLGRLVDHANGKTTNEMLLYDAKDLTTHAVCVGMTGSGKTGLCVSLLEEAAIDNIPAIVIDPKGDLGNLLLTFPGLTPAEFLPWIDPAEATRKGQTPEQYAADRAKLWKQGLADWGQDGSRIQKLRDAVDISIYTPGSSAGMPVRVLRSFSAPPPELIEQGDALQERISASVSGLLALLGIDADPIRSREHILLSNLLDHAWRAGQDLGIADLIRAIQSPPFDRVGVMDLEMIFPQKSRFELAMQLNNLLASPGFSSWMEGDPLDVNRFLYTAEGKPRLSIFSIAHLSDSERMFFVTLLLNEVVAWMRTQPGTSSLRALLYMDEVFGFFPPTANPPSKIPMLTLMKQARAFGLGVMLATQNPVDLDYKGLSNAGTWFLGRLQTERDKARVIEGLEGASAATGSAFDRAEMEAKLAGLGSRVFLMNNVHEDEPVLFHTRWAMSYLRGPLTRQQIQLLMAERKAEKKAATTQTATAGTTPIQVPVAAAPVPAMAEPETLPGTEKQPPVVPPGVSQRYISWRGQSPDPGGLLYRPALLANAQLHYLKAPAKIDHWEAITIYAPLPEDLPKDPWEDARLLSSSDIDLDHEPDSRGRFLPLASGAGQAKTYTGWTRALKTSLYRSRELPIYRCKELKAASNPGETEGDFRVRLGQAARERRDLAIEKLRQRYGKKLVTLKDRIARAAEKVDRERSQHKQQTFQTAVSVGATVLGALFGRKLASARTVGRASTAMRGAGRVAREKGDIARAEERLGDMQIKLEDLEREFADAVEAVEEKFDPAELELESLTLRPRKSDIAVDELALIWTPWRISPSGLAEPAFELEERP